MKRTDAIHIVEAAYDLGLSQADWLQQLCERLAPLLDHGRGTSLMEYQIEPDHQVRVGGFAQYGGEQDYREMATAAQKGLPPNWVSDVYLTPGTVGTTSELVARQHGLHDDVPLTLAGLPFDLFGFNLSHAPGRGVVASSPMQTPRRSTSAERKRLYQLTSHIRAGLRLRDKLSGASAIAEADAVFDAKHQLVHATEDAVNAQHALRQRVNAIDEARGALRRQDEVRALDIWQGLVDGTWSMVEAFDTDGTRFVVARRNLPHAPDPRGLTPRERQVCTLVATYAKNRDIAYELGLSPSTVSTLLQRAMRKLGTESRVALTERMVRAWQDEHRNASGSSRPD